MTWVLNCNCKLQFISKVQRLVTALLATYQTGNTLWMFWVSKHLAWKSSKNTQSRRIACTWFGSHATKCTSRIRRHWVIPWFTGWLAREHRFTAHCHTSLGTIKLWPAHVQRKTQHNMRRTGDLWRNHVWSAGCFRPVEQFGQTDRNFQKASRTLAWVCVKMRTYDRVNV